MAETFVILFLLANFALLAIGMSISVIQALAQYEPQFYAWEYVATLSDIYSYQHPAEAWR